jgi:hypothetical protein
MDIEVYTFEDADGAEQGYTTNDIAEAKRFARHHRLRLIANTFEWTDSELLEDNTPNTEDSDDDDPQPRD